MNKRLQAILSYIDDGTGVIDVGTDHAYLPTALAQSAYSGNIIAADINLGPLEAAERTAAAAGVHERICFQHCDGLAACDPTSVDTIVIAGMGGDTICGILDRSEWCMDSCYKLILQPMTKAEVLRYWLANNGYAFLDEELIKENGSIYQIIVSRFADKNTLMSDAELYTGCSALLKNKALYPEHLKSLIKRFEKSVDGLEKALSEEKVPQLRLKRSILEQLSVLEEYINDNKL